jgi:hypothetical protein
MNCSRFSTQSPTRLFCRDRAGTCRRTRAFRQGSGIAEIGAKVVAHGRYVTFQMAEVAVPRQMLADILSLIARLRAPPAPA